MTCAIVGDSIAKAIEAILDRIRAKASHRVIWILPTVDDRLRAMVVAVAFRHGDVVVSFAPGPDGVHPKSPPTLAADVARAMKGD